MLSKTITYKDFNGVEHTEKFWFHLSQSELTKKELSAKGGLKKQLERIIKDQDGAEIISNFEAIILDSYGVRSEDGSAFDKDAKWTREFKNSPAYDVMFMEIVTDAGAASEFVNGIMPTEMVEAMANVPEAKESTDDQPAWYKERRYPTKSELKGKSREEIQLALNVKRQGLFDEANEDEDDLLAEFSD